MRSFAGDIKHIASRILSHIDLERGLLHTARHATSHMCSDRRNEGITITCLILSPRQPASKSIEIYVTQHSGTDGVKM
jgi:hypothetical protein